MPYSKQVSFSSGDVDPRYFRRDDLSAYESFCSSTLNMYPTRSGAMTRRPGTIHFGQPKSQTDEIVLESFVFNTTEAILLEFGPSYIRFHTQDGTIQTGDPESPYEVVTTYLESELGDLDFVQINDVIIIVHPNHPPARLTRLANDNWTLEDIEFVDGPYLDINQTDITITLSDDPATGSNPRESSDPILFTASDDIFSASDVGRQFRIQIPSGPDRSQWMFGTITAYNSATEAVITPQKDSNADYYLDAPLPTFVWRFGAFQAGNYPSKVAFHQNRVVYANTPNQPSSFWASRIGQIDTFSPSSTVDNVDSIQAGDGFSGTLSSESAATILFVKSDTALLFGSESGLFASNVGQITPNNLDVTLTSSMPLADVTPLTVNNRLLAVTRHKNQVYAYSYSDDQKSYVPELVSIYWPHLFDRQIASMRYVEYPTPLVWFRMEDGTMLSMLFDSQQNLVGVTPHEIADSTVIDIQTLPELTSGYDSLWLLLNTDGYRSIVRMAREYDSSFYQEDVPLNAVFMDRTLVYTGEPTDNLAGLLHLADQDVFYIADGYIGTFTMPSSGDLTLPRAASTIQVGKNPECFMTTFDVLFSNRSETPFQHYDKRVEGVKIGYHDSNFVNIQPVSKGVGDTYQTDTIMLCPFFESATPATVDTGLSEYREIDSTTVPEVKFRLWVEEPLPLTITALYFNVTSMVK